MYGRTISLYILRNWLCGKGKRRSKMDSGAFMVEPGLDYMCRNTWRLDGQFGWAI
jgi:hypothetical protein